MEEIVSMIIPMVGFVCLVAIIKVVTDNRVRRRLAETHASDEVVKSMLESEQSSQREGALKWGIVSASTGAGLIIIDILSLSSEQVSTYGVIIVAAGVGLLVYYKLMKSKS
ncbi:DUF6249 domain-containing protein [Pleionea mediterranea]|jgi:hypothetical protein|uniref:DUF6249 domain-containing protein n=1 Tax=Pleionea mediterranea TaxID=523701 RepID=A0A316GI14_9GAMM|nr:DUF6249 domain-containing protein [Pleionea mediterranea]PWK54417.1 hypothetical protein C8D97_101265 [Pleionea mediterranea]